MPIYEYQCETCHKQTSVFIRNISQPGALSCTFCHGERLVRLISRIVTPKSEEKRMERLADPTSLAGLDEHNPQSMTHWMKEMAGEMGEDLGEDFSEEMESDAADALPSEAEDSLD
jgi:putative FmdB family regulatory protein